MVTITKEDLINFENQIALDYEKGLIRSPIHLAGGNEEQLIEIFREVRDNDWVFSTHRAHYHSLLKSKDPVWLRNEILNNRSLHLNSEKYKIFTSAIVAGVLPIALGTALAIKLKKLEDHVWCFVGDMAAETGMFHECTKYAKGYALPITFAVEDNGISVYTPTKEVWGSSDNSNADIRRHKYTRKYPHYGIGKWVEFPEERGGDPKCF